MIIASICTLYVAKLQPFAASLPDRLKRDTCAGDAIPGCLISWPDRNRNIPTKPGASMSDIPSSESVNAEKQVAHLLRQRIVELEHQLALTERRTSVSAS